MAGKMTYAQAGIRTERIGQESPESLVGKRGLQALSMKNNDRGTLRNNRINCIMGLGKKAPSASHRGGILVCKRKMEGSTRGKRLGKHFR